jgi:geranylgeranyl diphosphate synthase, type III
VKTAYSQSPSINGEDKAWNILQEQSILAPYNYLLRQPGKDIRSAMIDAFDDFLHIPVTSTIGIKKAINMLHNASLLIDDIQDNSTLRRGLPAAHTIFGVPQTINSANYVYFLALEEVKRLGDAATDIYTTEMINLHRGQGIELFWRDNFICPSEEDYLEMVRNKTGGLFRLLVKLMLSESSETMRRDLVPLSNHFGCIFQIYDDYLNLCSATYSKNKGWCEDLTEGKFSFLSVHSINSKPWDTALRQILKAKTQDETMKWEAVKYMEATGSFEYTRTVLKGLKSEALKMIRSLERNGSEGNKLRKILERIELGQ